MYEDYSFIEETEVTVPTFTEALELVAERDYQSITTTFGKLGVSDAGQIVIDGTDHEITEWGFEKFCGLLGIPRPFARKIPEDLLKENVDRLLKEKNEAEELQFFSSKKGLIGVGRKNYDPFVGSDFLTQMSVLKDIELQSAIINERGVTVNYFKDIPDIEPVQGDTVKVGFNVHNSDTGGTSTMSNLYLYRLVCENGATMREAWGSAKRTYNKKIAKETALLNFYNQTEQLSTNAGLLVECLKDAVDTDATDEHLQKAWGSLKRVIGSEARIDDALEIQEEERKTMFKEVSKRKTRNRSGLINNQPLESPITIGRSYYDLFNQVTAMEKNHKLDEKVTIRKIGGDMIYNLLKVKAAAL